MYPAEPKRRNSRTILIAVGVAVAGVVAVCCVGGIAASMGSKTAKAEPSESPTVGAFGVPIPTKILRSEQPASPPETKPSPATESPAGPATSIDRDGTYLVGVDIQPGTYRSTNPGSCYWARLRGMDGSIDSIIANDLVASGGVVTISVAKTDKALEVKRCGDLKKMG